MKEHLTQLILYDTEIKALNEKINDLKKSKRETEEYVKQCILNEHLQHKVFILNHKKIKYTETKTYQPFSFKYIEQRLGEWIDRESLTQICPEEHTLEANVYFDVQ